MGGLLALGSYAARSPTSHEQTLRVDAMDQMFRDVLIRFAQVSPTARANTPLSRKGCVCLGGGGGHSCVGDSRARAPVLTRVTYGVLHPVAKCSLGLETFPP